MIQITPKERSLASTGGQTTGQKDRQTDRQAGRQTEKDRQTSRQKEKFIFQTENNFFVHALAEVKRAFHLQEFP